MWRLLQKSNTEMFIECVSASSLSCELMIYSLASIMQVISGQAIMGDIWILIYRWTQGRVGSTIKSQQRNKCLELICDSHFLLQQALLLFLSPLPSCRSLAASWHRLLSAVRSPAHSFSDVHPGQCQTQASLSMNLKTEGARIKGKSGEEGALFDPRICGDKTSVVWG